MKNNLALLFAATAVVLGVICVVQRQQLANQEAELVSLRAELHKKAQQVADLQTSQQRAERERRQLLRQAAELAAQAEGQQLNATEAAPVARTEASPSAGDERSDKGVFGKFLSQVMDDPEIET